MRRARPAPYPASVVAAVAFAACATPVDASRPDGAPDGVTAEVTIDDRLVGTADLRAACGEGATTLTLRRVRFADARPFAGLRDHATLRRVAFVETGLPRAATLDDVLAMPALEELDLGALPGLGRTGGSVSADVEALVLLAALARSEPRTPRARLRLRGRHGSSLDELLQLAAQNAAAEDLRGVAGLDAAGPGAPTPPRPFGSSFLPEQKQLAAALQLRALAPELRARFELAP